MFNTAIVDRRSTTQEVHNYTETNVECSGSIVKIKDVHRFISFDTSKQVYKTIFSSEPFYIERVQKENGYSKGYLERYEKMSYKEIDTKISVSVKQVLVTGKIFTLEVVEIGKEDVSRPYNSDDKKSVYFNNPTIL